MSGRHPLELLPDELLDLLSSWSQPAYRAGQVFRWMHGRGVLDPRRMTDLPAGLRKRLAGVLGPVASKDRTLVSADGGVFPLWAIPPRKMGPPPVIRCRLR